VITQQTYLGDPQLKAAFLAEITKHEDQDALIKGTYGQMNGHFTGCAIGCSLHSLNVLQGKVGKASTEHTGNHARYERSSACRSGSRTSKITSSRVCRTIRPEDVAAALRGGDSRRRRRHRSRARADSRLVSDGRGVRRALRDDDEPSARVD
jgi:hypothetical protein